MKTYPYESYTDYRRQLQHWRPLVIGEHLQPQVMTLMRLHGWDYPTAAEWVMSGPYLRTAIEANPTRLVDIPLGWTLRDTLDCVYEPVVILTQRSLNRTRKMLTTIFLD